MGIRFLCPNGHKLNVKTFLAGKRAICPDCGAKVLVPDATKAAAESSADQANVLHAATRSNSHSLSDMPSPSSAVASAEIELEEPRPAIRDPAAGTSSFHDARIIPESIVVGPKTGSFPVMQGESAGEAANDLRRARARQYQIRIAIGLLLLVILLAGLLIWVLKRSMNAPAEIHEEPAKVGETGGVFPLVVALNIFYSDR